MKPSAVGQALVAIFFWPLSKDTDPVVTSVTVVTETIICGSILIENLLMSSKLGHQHSCDSCNSCDGGADDINPLYVVQSLVQIYFVLEVKTPSSLRQL